MLLTPHDAGLFFKLHRTLMFFVNQRLRVVPADRAGPVEFAALPPEVRLRVRDAFLEHTDLIQTFVDENPARLSGDELGIVRSWQHLVHGKFYVLRELKNCTVFLSTGPQAVAYGVLALAEPFEDLIGRHLPVLMRTVLLPFKGMIVYDGLMSGYNISFGGGIRRSLNESFKDAKIRHGIDTSLPMSERPVAIPAKKPKAMPRPSVQPKVETAEVLRVIVGMIDQFCREHLNDEYAVLCRKLAEKLARKRPSPLLGGSPNTWASGIVRTVGWVTFLHDKSQTPYMRLSDIAACFGISESSGAANLSHIRNVRS